MFPAVRRLLTFLPGSNREAPPVRYSGDPLDRRNDKLLEIVPAERKQPYNVIKVIEEIVDDHDFFEVQQHWAKNMVVGFARIHGHSIGVIGNQPNVLAGTLDINASDKASRFIRFCDCFGIALLYSATRLPSSPARPRSSAALSATGLDSLRLQRSHGPQGDGRFA